VNPPQNERPTAESRTLRRDEGDEAILFDPSNGAIHSLNPTARRVWELCDGAHTIDEIAGILEAEYELSAGQSRGDVAAVIEEMRTLGLIRGI
jgi:PqqD family protein of HPr-rel-A system